MKRYEDVQMTVRVTCICDGSGDPRIARQVTRASIRCDPIQRAQRVPMSVQQT